MDSKLRVGFCCCMYTSSICLLTSAPIDRHRWLRGTRGASGRWRARRVARPKPSCECVEVAELTNSNQRLSKEKEQLEAEVNDMSNQKLQTFPEAPQSSSNRQLAVLNNSNFAKMMNMQQEINQLKAHIEAQNRKLRK
eukprot:6212475-Pleurochrysis_carterae.AAC.2